MVRPTSRLSIFLAVTGLLALMQPNPGGGADAEQPSPRIVVDGKLLSETPNADSVRIAEQPSLKEIDLAVDSPLRDQITRAEQNDNIQVEVDDKDNPRRITAIDTITRPVRPGDRLIALTVALLVLIAAAALATKGRPLMFLLGVDNRYSNSQCQIALWFGAVATVYLAANALRIAYLGWDFVGGVGLSQNLVALTGLSALTFGGAKVITAQKVAAAEQSGAPSPKVAAAQPNILTDLVQNDFGAADFGDFEMIMVALAAVMIFVLGSFHFLGALALQTQITLPDVDSTVLSGFGLGQGAYLVKKAALRAGQG